MAKANHSMVYAITGDNYSDLGTLKRAGIIDYHYIIHGGGATPPAQFPKDCAALGISPILNNGNDGIAGWDGSPQYYKNVAALGYMAAGGESEQAPEIDSIMDNLIFMDYGGQGTGGGTNDNLWYVTHPGNVHGHGAASYLETYDASTNLWDWNVMGQGILNCKSHGVKEIGLLVGNWMMGHSSAQDYVNLANSIEAHGVTCAGILVWGGYGTSMNGLYNQFAPWFKAWQAIWPPNMMTIDKRFGAPTPPPTPPTPVPKRIIDTFYTLASNNGLDLFGVVLDQNNKPMKGQKVSLYRDWELGNKEEMNVLIGDTKTNASGQYIFTPRDMKPGMWTFKVKTGSMYVTLLRTFVRG